MSVLLWLLNNVALTVLAIIHALRLGNAKLLTSGSRCSESTAAGEAREVAIAYIQAEGRCIICHIPSRSTPWLLSSGKK